MGYMVVLGFGGVGEDRSRSKDIEAIEETIDGGGLRVGIG